MTKVVYKYELIVPDGPPGTLGRVRVPRGAEVRRVAEQGRGRFFAWAVVDPSKKDTILVEFLALGTGHEFDPELLELRWKHKETVLALGGALVVHFWIGK